MLAFLKKYGYGLWLGFSLGIVDVLYTSWEFWFVLIPTAILVIINEEK